MFEGSVLAYNPAKNEAEWIPVWGLTNDLTWAEERSMVALENYVPHIPEEAAQITGLWTHHLVSLPTDDSSTLEEEEVQHPELLTMDTEHKWEEESEDGARQTDLEEDMETNRWQHSWDWEAVMGESEKLAYDDPWSDSDAMVMGGRLPMGACIVTPHP